MPALINIEIYQPKKICDKSQLNQIIREFIKDEKLKHKIHPDSVNDLNVDGVFRVVFECFPSIEFHFYIQELELKENWYALEICTEYKNVLTIESNQVQYYEGVKNSLVEILKLLNKYFDSPMLLVTSEIANGYFFEHYFGDGSIDLADFELGLFKKRDLNLNLESYKLQEETKEYYIYVQENNYVKWD